MWEQFLAELAERRELAFLSVAVDVDPQRPVAYAQGLPFPTVVDSAGQLGRLFDFDVVPNGVFVDESGAIRFMHIGGFDIRRPEVAQQINTLLDTDFSKDATPAAVQTRSKSSSCASSWPASRRTRR